MDYVIHIMTMAGIYIILASSLNLLAGYTGLVSVGHAAFYGIGAYTTALLGTHFGLPFSLNLICAVALSSAVGALVGIPSLRIRDDYFIIATFAFQAVAFNIFNNWIEVTNGPMGVTGIPRAELFGFTFDTQMRMFLLVVVACCIVLSFLAVLVHSPFGRVLRAIREDEVFALAAGKNCSSFKILVSVAAAGVASVAGVLFAYFIGFVDPTSFTVMESIFIISLVIIGGAGSFSGPILGAVILVGLPELLRFLGMPAGVAANIRQILYGVALIACMFWRPTGLVGSFSIGTRRTASS